MKKILIAFVCVIALIVSTYYIFIHFSEYKLNIYFFESGKSDSILITYEDKVILIDTALEEYSDEIIRYLKSKNIELIDCLIITHFDKDHVGGASKIIDNFEVLSVYQPSYNKESEYYNKYKESLDKKNITPIKLDGDVVTINFDDFSLELYGSSIVYLSDTSNNSSIITSLKYKDNSFLFTGDIENERIIDFVNLDIDEHDVIKMPHHGKYHKELKSLLDKINPKYAVITTSNESKEEEKTVNLLKKYNIKYYTTRDNSVLIKSNGKGIKFYN